MDKINDLTRRVIDLENAKRHLESDLAQVY